MNWERLQQIKHRVSKNQSAPDMPDMARELIEALEKHVKPAAPVAQAAVVVVDQSAADEARKEVTKEYPTGTTGEALSSEPTPTPDLRGKKGGKK